MYKDSKNSCIILKNPLPGIYLHLIFENAYTKAERDSVLKGVWTLSRGNSLKTQKMNFQYFAKVSEF